MDISRQIHAYFDAPAARDTLVEAIGRLVRVPSVEGPAEPGKPFGPGPAAALEEALKLCRSWGFSARSYDGYVGLADLSDAPTALHILGHLDVVAPGTGWTVTQPFEPRVVDGMLYGRGVADDKGPTVAALLAMRAVRDLGIPLSRNVRLILGTAEESGSADIAYYYAREPYAPMAFTPDADFPLIHIEKGQYHPDFGARWDSQPVLPRVSVLEGGIRANVVPPEARAFVLGLEEGEVAPLCARVEEQTGAQFTLTREGEGLQLTCSGRNAHASTPQLGNNAITALLCLLAQLPLASCSGTRAIRALHTLFPHGDTQGLALGIAQADQASGALTLNLALIKLDETGVSAKIDVRAPLCATEDNCPRTFEGALAAHGMAVTGDGALLPGHHVPAGSPLVRTLLDAYQRYTGVRDAVPMAIGGGTYVHNIPGGVAFGPNMPGFDCRMHAADERIPVDDLLTACKIFTHAIIELCR